MDSPRQPPVHCIVPARMGSSRFPGKPLVNICGTPMVVRTLQRARAASCFERIVCATDSAEIAQVVNDAGFESVLTPECATGSDRVSIAAGMLNLDLVVNLQGDEPVASLTMLQRVAEALAQEPTSWVTASSPLSNADYARHSVVKVLVHNGYALDFVRELPPEASGWHTHRGIYAYSAESRTEFAALPQSRLETERSLEQMRILGKRPVRVVADPDFSASVDTPADVSIVESLIKEMQL